MKEYFRLLLQFNRSPTLCNFLQLFAYDTWQRVEFGRSRNGFKVFETTITQNILYEFCIYCDLFPMIPMRMFEAINEPLNGNDIELIIQTSEGFIIVPLQAKIIYSTDNYPAMEHSNQINDLIAYANKVGGVPLYLLYNYYSDNTFAHIGNLCDIRFPKEQFGCSLVSAHYLLNNFAYNRTDRNGNLKWTIPTFTDLHPSIAIPWFVLGCCRNSETNTLATTNLINNFPKTGSGLDQKIITYKYEELINDNKWKPLNLKGLNFSKDFIESESIKFSPKYRIVLGFDEQK
jgi:hypothetical protein